MWKVLDMLRYIFKLENSGYDFPRSPQEALEEDPKAVKTLPWKFPSTKPKHASSVHQRSIGGDKSMGT